ncbi:hypothetical protein ACIBJI_39965 [Nocardia sp. NPDC050408]|uniref:hypothetical protein n=1 Tax=Nocardia sp. NPDC050408 TaxID=3364319 RepID=UPI00378CC929
MSRGLGITQRRLLSALYAAPLRQLLRWDLDDLDADDLWAFPRGVHPGGSADFSDGSEFYLVAQLGLAELHHLTLRDSPRRSVEQRKLGLMDWFSLNAQPSTEAELDLLRSWRAAYRRAARSLTGRDFIETVQASVHLENLGQLIWGMNANHIPAREVVLARITDAGRQYVQQRRAELIDDTPSTDDLRRALRSAGFHDIAEPHPQSPPSGTQSRRRRIGTPRKRTQPDQNDRMPESTTQPSRLLGREDVLTQFTAEGFDTGRVEAALRAWHREEQRKSRELFGLGDNGIPLHEQLFGQEEIDDLRRRLT